MYSLFRHCHRQRNLMLRSSVCGTFVQLPLQCLTVYELCRTYSYFTYLPTSRESIVFTTKSATQNGQSSNSIDDNNNNNNNNSKSNNSHKDEGERQKVNKNSLLCNWVENTFEKNDKESLQCLANSCRRRKKKLEQMRKKSNLQSKSIDIDELLKTNKMEDPKALTYPLYTMNKISDVITRSIIAHRNSLFVECNYRARSNMIPRKSLEDTCNNTVPHNALYFRIVDTSQFCEETASAKAGGVKMTNQTSYTHGSVNNAHSHINVSPELIKQVWSGIKKILTDYAVHAYSPFSGEWVCDVTHYCEIQSLIAAAHKSVNQFERDAEAFCNGAAVPEKHGFAGEVDIHALAPLPVEKVVTEIACRIRDEVLCSLLDANSSSSSSSNDASSNDFINNDDNSNSNSENGKREHSNGNKNSSEDVETPERDASENVLRRTAKHSSPRTLTSFPRTLKICIGVGTSPFWAKVACDAEVKAVCKNAMNDTTPVHIRSYHKYTRTAQSRREFMGKLTFAELPIVKPAFAKLLNDVFGIVKCADILRLCEQLQQTFSLETFKYCYAIALGCAELPGEKNAMLVMHNKFIQQNALLESIAANSISLTNETRTTFGSPANYMTKRFKNRGVKTINLQNVYGRLISDRQFVQAVARATTRNITTLHKICKKCSRLRIDFYIDGRNVDHAEVMFKPTADFDTILAHGIRLAKSCADKREHVGKSIRGEVYAMFVALTSLEPIVMIPAKCQNEIRALTERYVKWRSHVVSYRNQYFKKRKNQSRESKPKRSASEQSTGANVSAVVRNSSHYLPVVARSSALLLSSTPHETKNSATKKLSTL